jgi:hypothetical protein
MGSIAEQTKGYIGGDALYFVNEAKGILHLGTPSVTFDSKLTSGAPLPYRADREVVARVDTETTEGLQGEAPSASSRLINIFT